MIKVAQMIHWYNFIVETKGDPFPVQHSQKVQMRQKVGTIRHAFDVLNDNNDNDNNDNNNNITNE